MNIIKDTIDEKRVNYMPPDSFFHLAHLHFCFFWVRNVICVPFLSHSNRPPVFSCVYHHYNRDNTSQLPLDYVWSCDWILANGVRAAEVYRQLSRCVLGWSFICVHKFFGSPSSIKVKPNSPPLKCMLCFVTGFDPTACGRSHCVWPAKLGQKKQLASSLLYLVITTLGRPTAR